MPSAHVRQSYGPSMAPPPCVVGSFFQKPHVPQAWGSVSVKPVIRWQHDEHSSTQSVPGGQNM